MAGEGVRTKGAAAPEEQAMGEQLPAKERRGAEASRCVEVALSGGAPWGFTLRGGREHKEPLLITKIEEGSKAAALGKLQVGDEMVSINDVILTGYRQEAICLVKGSHRTLKIVVRRCNEPACRPHSWHSTKFTDSQPESAMMQLSWHSRSHAISSSNDLSNTWNQTNLHRTSDQFSSLGSMDSLDQPPPIYQHGRLSPAKSSNSMDHITQHNKRDSAYSSFSTSSSTPDYTLSSSKSDNSSSTEHILSRMTPWEATRPGNGRQSQSAADQNGLEEKQGHLTNEDGVSSRPEEQLSSRHYSSGRASFGPVWHVPEKRITSDSRVPRRASPPPPPPVRSDSFTATKVHEKVHISGLSDGNGPSRHQASGKPQIQGNWAQEVTERELGAESRRLMQASPPYMSDVSPPALSDNSRQPYASKLQYSLSSTDVRFSQPNFSSSHQRQYSDESTFYHTDADWTRTTPSSTFYHSPQELSAESSQYYDQTQARPAISALAVPTRLSPDNSSQNRYYCVTSRQPTQVATRPPWVKVECRDGVKGVNYPSSPSPNNMAAPSTTPRPPRYQPSPPDNSSLSRLEAGGRVRIGTPANGTQKLNEEERRGRSGSGGTVYGLDPSTSQSYQQPGYSDGDPYQPLDSCWLEMGGMISPDRTPMLHSLAQESRSLQAPWADGSGHPPLLDVSPQSKQQQRSDRFATALRNEIQTKRAQLQKSKSAAALTGNSEVEAAAGSCQEQSPPNSASASDGSYSASYKDDLKEAQARVLRATSFKRRDLGPVVAPRQYPMTDPRTPAYPAPAVSLASKEGPPAMMPGHHRAPVQASAHHLARVGGRKRLTPEQKLRSYSEPEKMNQVGVPDEVPASQPGTTPLRSFADRRQFFEVVSKMGRPIQAYCRPPPKQGPLPSGGEAQWRLPRKCHSTDAEECPSKAEGRAQSRSLSCESATGAPDPGRSWPLRNTAAQPSRLPRQPTPTGNLNEQDPSGYNAEPERLGTFAEYQASWREQWKVSEARSSGRFHSADNILEQSFQGPVGPQYVHGRSRSSPTSDFYIQEVPIDVRRHPEGYQKAMDRSALTAGGGRASLPVRHQDSGSTENTSEGQKFTLEQKSEHNWSERNVQASGNQPQEWHERAVTMLSGQRYPGADEDEFERKAEVDHLQTCTESQTLSKYWASGENLTWAEEKLAAGRKGATPTKSDKYRPQELPCSGTTLLPQPTQVPPDLPCVGTTGAPASGTDLPPSSATGAGQDSRESQLSECSRHAHLGGGPLKDDSSESLAFHFIAKLPLDVPRSPSPQFAPQRLTDKPPLTVEDDILTRIEKVTENNMTVKKVPIKIVRSESQTEKESRHNLLNNVDLIGFGEKEQPEGIGACENPYSLFAAYSRQEPKWVRETGLSIAQSEAAASNPRETEELSPVSGCVKTKEKNVEDTKSEELAREIVDKDRSLADILYPNSKMKTTMDLMEGIFPKDDTLLQEAQQRRKLLPSRSYSPKTTEEREDEILPIGDSLTTSSTYYSTSAPKAELLNKMKDMQQQMEEEEDSEDELSHDLTEKKQELIDSISKKLQVLREARESLQDDIQANNLLGDEVEAFVKEVCKPNEFEKFRMFIGDLDKVVNLLLSLSGRLARVENALNTLEESASPDERRTLTQKQKLLTRQHEDAKELKENLDRRERVVLDILCSYLTDELLQDYEHFVKMKSALIIEQRELEDKIKLGEEQLKCLLESLPLDSKPM
ncbi:protein Shroom2 isoform X2 [Scyliorhinus canicula]|uniref:protein Shroom2 isoform X2 n=1 Tax=Scyliorhinus canicula TaxID=7830 RepID=UPI0018F5F266|nr:protein Shroom2 isoform X2 [Scyliorhinus canicula]